MSFDSPPSAVVAINGTVIDSPPPQSSVAAGAGAPVAAAGPRLPRREEWLDLPEDAYPGFKVKVWVNYPRRLNDDLTSRDKARMTAVLLQVVLEHNGWCDTDGSPLPAANDARFWDDIPDELAGAVLSLLFKQVGKLGYSLSTRSER